jgi:hypothetical protein
MGMKKLLAFALAAAFAFAFAACGSGGGTLTAGEEAPTAEVTSAPAAESGAAETTEKETSATEEVTEGTEKSSDEPDTGGTAEDDAPGEAVPTDLAGIVDYFNAALGRTGMRRVSFKRTMTKVTAWAAYGLVDEPDLQDWRSVQALANVDETKNAPSDLVALRQQWIREAKSDVGGGAATLTIRLENHALAEIDPKPGTYGYVSTIDKAEATQLVIDASILLTNGILTSAEVTKALFSLENGAYTVVIDTNTGKIKSLRFTGTQSADGEAKCRASILPIPGNATVTLRGELDAAYMPV